MNKPDLTVDELTKCSFPGYWWLLKVGKEWVKTREPARIKDAIELFECCRTKYPHAPQFGVEQALAHIELDGDNEKKAEAILQEIEPLFGTADEELLCRWGRIFKDRGDGHAEKNQNSLAKTFYQRSHDQYEAAFRVRGGHYPGINKATMLLVQASLSERDSAEQQRLLNECAATAKDLLAHRHEWPRTLPDDNVWHRATEAEAHCLEGRWTEAGHAYRSALAESNCEPFHRESMSKQARRILHAYRAIGREKDLHGMTEIENIFPNTSSPPVAISPAR